MSTKIWIDNDEIILKLKGKRASYHDVEEMDVIKAAHPGATIKDSRSVTQNVSGDGNVFSATGNITISD